MDPNNEKEPVPAKRPPSFLLNTDLNIVEHVSDHFKM